MNNETNFNVDNIIFPCLIFYKRANPDYNKEPSMEDIPQPSREVYNYVVDDMATFGRTIPTYEEWAEVDRLKEFQQRLKSSKCPISVEKIAVESFEDVERIYNEDPTIEFLDDRLNKLFAKFPNDKRLDV